MVKIEFDLETTLPPKDVVDLLIDFSPSRPDRWPGLDPKQYQVYSVGETSAEVREGNPPNFWARERYDWATPNRVRWEVLESSFCKPGSYVQATVRERGQGGSTVHIEWSRTPTTFSANVIMAILRLTRGAPIKASIGGGLRRAEAAVAT